MTKLKSTLNPQDVTLLKGIFATKDDLKKLEQRSRATFATKDDLEDTKYELQQQSTTYRDELMTKLDKILKEILASRQEQTLNTHKLSDHEDRIASLEKKVFPASN